MLRLLPFALTLVALPAHATNWRSTSALKDRTTFQDLISTLDAADADIDAWAVEPDGDWFVTANDQVWASPGFSRGMVTAAQLNLMFGRELRAADCNAVGTCVLVHSAGHYATGAIPAALASTITSWTNSGTVVRDVELTTSGWLLLGPNQGAAYAGLDGDLAAAIYDRHATGRVLQDVSIGTDGRWMLLANNNPMDEGLSSTQRSTLDAVVRDEQRVDKLLLGNLTSFVLYNGDDDRHRLAPADPFSAIELTAGGTNVWDRMAALGVVGISVAVIEDNEVVAGRGYGRRQLGADGAILSSTPFDLASLSKYLGALTTQATLEQLASDGDPSNDLFLDDDVLDVMVPDGNVARWKEDGERADPVKGFPDDLPPLPEGMTLRRLLSHTGSMLSRGSTPALVPWVSSAAPSVWMSGWSCPDGGCLYRTDAYAWVNPAFGPPGTDYQYSNAGFMLTQATLTDHLDAPASVLMQDLLFDPLGLSDISGHFPLAADFLARRSRQHDTITGLQGQWEYPWTFGGGVNASAADYAELLILALNEGRASDGTQLLSEEAIAEMMVVNDLNDGRTSAYGLGLILSDGTATETNGAGIWHNGGHPEQAVTWFCGVPSRDQGIVVLLNTDSDSVVGSAHVNNLVDDIIDAYRGWAGWPSSVSCGI